MYTANASDIHRGSGPERESFFEIHLRDEIERFPRKVHVSRVILAQMRAQGLQQAYHKYVIVSFLHILGLIFHSYVQYCVLVVRTQFTKRRHNISNVLHHTCHMLDKTAALLQVGKN